MQNIFYFLLFQSASNRTLPSIGGLLIFDISSNCIQDFLLASVKDIKTANRLSSQDPKAFIKIKFRCKLNFIPIHQSVCVCIQAMEASWSSNLLSRPVTSPETCRDCVSIDLSAQLVTAVPAVSPTGLPLTWWRRPRSSSCPPGRSTRRCLSCSGPPSSTSRPSGCRWSAASRWQYISLTWTRKKEILC